MRRLRIAILGLFHESNTFAEHATTIDHFESYQWHEGRRLVEAFADSHHEIGGMLAVLDEAEGVETVPLIFAGALPAGPITPDAETHLWSAARRRLDEAGPVDGVLAAVHGAAVGTTHRDFDGWWLSRLRQAIGAGVPLVATLDPHANVSQRMAQNADALLAYRTNPHVDQRAVGRRAGELVVASLRGQCDLCTAHVRLPMMINIERQLTDDPPCRTWLDEGDRIAEQPGVLSTSLILGYPYADVAEMGAGVVVVGDRRACDPGELAAAWARSIWASRHLAEPMLTDPAAAARRASKTEGTLGLLDMGDNVGGGSYGDQTALAHTLVAHGVSPFFVNLSDADAYAEAEAAGVGGAVSLRVGGRHEPEKCGPPLPVVGRVIGLTDGTWTDPEPRHGGRVRYDVGPLAMVQTHDGSVVQVSRYAVFPVSLGQLTHAALSPQGFRAVVIKGVHAPVAAYRDAVAELLRVNSPGPTSADVSDREYSYRTRPMFPFEPRATFATDRRGP